jgi:hypothetical protein
VGNGVGEPDTRLGQRGTRAALRRLVHADGDLRVEDVLRPVGRLHLDLDDVADRH